MIIKINDKQEDIIKNEIIKEAVGFGFSIEYMKQIRSLKGRYEYCKQFLGNPIGRGSSRVVFQYDDNIVIKLALNSKGIGQNEVEYDKFSDYSTDVFPKIYNELSDEETFKFITTEYVLPAKDKDFEQCLGVDFRYYCNVICTWRIWQYGRNTYIPYWCDELDAEDVQEITSYGNWDSLKWYFQNYDIQGFNDLLKLSSYGITNRNGELEIVILDAGLNDEVWKKYYVRESKEIDKEIIGESIKIHKGEKGKTKSTQGKWQDSIDCPHCGESKAFFSMSISDGNRGRGRIKVTDEQGKEVDSEVQTIALYYCPKCYRFTALNNMA